MTARSSRSGFTLLEVLVASILLGMLVTILTMVFNSSSIAWRTGRASVAEMDTVRKNMAGAGIVADNALPRVDMKSSAKWGLVVSPWKANGELRKRGVEELEDWYSLTLESKGKIESQDNGRIGDDVILWGTLEPGQIRLGRGVASYAVGVMSLGPDCIENTKDDISTWPDTK